MGTPAHFAEHRQPHERAGKAKDAADLLRSVASFAHRCTLGAQDYSWLPYLLAACGNSASVRAVPFHSS